MTYDDESKSMVCNGNATQKYYQYEDESSDPVISVLYTNGSGSFYEADGVIIWNDAEENRGADMKFVRSEY